MKQYQPLFTKKELNRSVTELESSIQQSSLQRKQKIIQKGYKENIKYDRTFNLKLIFFLLILELILQLFPLLKAEYTNPLLFNIYTYLLLLTYSITIVGLYFLKNWARLTIISVSLFQITFKVYLMLLFFQTNKLFDRSLSILISIYLIYYFNTYNTKLLFKK